MSFISALIVRRVLRSIHQEADPRVYEQWGPSLDQAGCAVHGGLHQGPQLCLATPQSCPNSSGRDRTPPPPPQPPATEYHPDEPSAGPKSTGTEKSGHGR